MKSIKSDEFFKLISLNSGGLDIQISKDVFYGVLKTITRELRDKQTVKVPDFGEFSLKIRPARRIIDINRPGTFINLPALPEVKFYPEEKVKEYFHRIAL